MSGWDVFSDAIKIGLPSLLTAAVAFILGRSTRAHDFEKERRRRRQELLERSLDDFESSHAKFEILSRLFNSYCDLETAVKDESFWPPMKDAMSDARDKLEALGKIEGRFTMMNLPECAKAIDDYRLAARKMVFAVSFRLQPPSENREPFDLAEKYWQEQRKVVESRVAAAYSQL